LVVIEDRVSDVSTNRRVKPSFPWSSI